MSTENTELATTTETSPDAKLAQQATSIEIPQEEASHTDVIEPISGVIPEDLDWAEWAHERRDLGQESQDDYVSSDEKLRLAVSYLALEIAYRPDHDWKAEAMDAGVTIPKSKHPCMPATAATFGANTIGQTGRHDLATFLDRTALAVENLTAAIQSDPVSYPVSSVGVMALEGVIKQRGGLTKMAAEQRKNNKAKRKPRPQREAQIALDPELSREVHLEKARAVVFGDGSADDVQVAFVAHDGAAPTLRATVPATQTQIDTLLLSVDVVDPVIAQVGELLEASEMVAEEDTELLKDGLDDPEDPEKGVRVAHRQIVFEDGEPVTISPILVHSSVVVLADPVDEIFPHPLGRRCHLRTRERRIMDANIADPQRRHVFQGEWQEAGVTNGVVRLVVTTRAAADPADRDRNVGCLVEPLQSAQGNLPLTVHPDRFNAQCEGEMSLRTWRSRHNEFIAKVAKGKAKQAKAKQDHHFSGDRWNISAGKKDDERDASGKGTAVSVSLMEGDFARVSSVIAALPVISAIRYAADRNAGLRLAFSTSRFNYEVYVPSRTTAADRNASLFSVFENAE
ncbi:hypothetical protein [Aliihoeflea sp. 2WW]|uniref:hypothetical protein n=1 Tax=Aliihoeflea sp. 2WW TaxID=1381123 RepID=UPI00046384AD|nr:hypothetical protein [Aliihoeflea sp. 2WW]